MQSADGIESCGAAIALKSGERLDSLEYKGLRIIQRADAFCFGTDSVLLADFARVKPGDRVADMGAGSGVVSILMASREPTSRYDAIEVQPDVADMAARSVALNGMEDRITVRALDFREAARQLGYERFSLTVCNPPYGKAGSAPASEDVSLRVARHETVCDIGEIASAASALLKVGGRAAFVYPAQRAFELMCALQAARLAPKRLRAVHHDVFSAPKLILLDAVKCGGSQLHWLAPLILYGPDGPTEEWKRIYRVEGENEGKAKV